MTTYPLPPAVNFAVLKECNFHCRFCYSTFQNIKDRLSDPDAEKVVRLLADAGIEKITFVGGEPTLHTNITGLINTAHQAGLVTTLVSNGTGLTQVLDTCAVDWVGLDLDSIHENIETQLGRGRGGHVQRTYDLADECHRRGIKLKLNTVVTALSWEENMSEAIKRIQPDRWKGFQVLPVAGQNDGKVESLLITSEQFRAWTERHVHLKVIAETNELMSLSYALIDPLGRFYASDTQGHLYGRSILDVGVEKAWASIPFHQDRFEARGGRYDWR